MSLLVRCPNFKGLNVSTSKGKIRDLLWVIEMKVMAQGKSPTPAAMFLVWSVLAIRWIKNCKFHI